jgi:hypothetical protein
MKRSIRTLGMLLGVAAIPLLGIPFVGFAADHGDSPSATASAEPTADITDLYAWQDNDKPNLNLVLGVNSNAGADATFSDAVTYVFHVQSSQNFGQAQTTTLITCKFVDGTNIECWAGDDYVAGNPSNPAGIASEKGYMRVFAGLRDDPFFLDYTAFGETVAAVVAATGVQADDEGCPLLTPEQLTYLQNLLTKGGRSGTPSNTFAGQNVLALVLEVDTAILTDSGPVLSVWASTHASN